MSKSPFLRAVSDDMRLRGYSLRTEHAYLHWIKRYILFNHKRHPETLGKEEIAAFLTYLAVERHVAINTQKVALNALAFLYQKFLRIELGDLGFSLATKQRHLPVVLSAVQVAKIIAQLDGAASQIVQMLYSSGLRVSECLRLRIQDVDLDRLCVTVRDGKGNKDRQTLLAASCIPWLQLRISSSFAIQQKDNALGVGPSLPHALGRKYPGAFRSPAWMFIFPSTTRCAHPVTGELCRHHLHESLVRKALSIAGQKIGLCKKISCHTFRHSFIKYFPVFPLRASGAVQIQSR